MEENGKLIVLEAVDDRALAQLSEELCRSLRRANVAIEETCEPTYGPAGTQILLAQQGRLQFDATSLALLYLADRLDHVQQAGGIADSLANGVHVICRHYELAAAARLWGQEEWGWLCSIGAPCRKPDLTLFADFGPEGSRQGQLREGYLAAIERVQDTGQVVTIVDGANTPAGLVSACEGHIGQLLDINLPDFG
jgi:thymidylate kinase